jgi:hypothetical protein
MSSRLYNGNSGFVLFRLSGARREFLAIDRVDRDYSGTVSGTRRINSRNEVIVGVTRFQRNSSVELAGFTNTTLFIEYRGRL